jgi:hypothetical protein
VQRDSARRTTGLALLAALGAAGCAAEPPTVQLVIRADPGVAEQLEHVRVQVTASRTTDARVPVCSPCERTFPRVGDAVPMPIVVDYVRGVIPYDEAHFTIEYVATDGTVRKKYHNMAWPESGVLSNEVLLEQLCMEDPCPPRADLNCEGVPCLPGNCPQACHCMRGICFQPDFPAEVLAEIWLTTESPACSSSCLAEMDADGDADADGTGEGDGRTDADARDGPDAVDGGADVADAVVPWDGTPSEGGSG